MTEKERFDSLYQSLSTDNKLIHVGLLSKRAANLWPDRTFVICDDNTITYNELYHRSQILADQLQQLGVKPGDRVLILWENSIEFYVAYFAVWQSGAIVAPLNIFLHENEVTHIIDDAQPKVIIVSPEQISKIKNYPQDKLPAIINKIDNQAKISENIDFVIPERNIEDTAALLYTSGTTGFPKAVMLSSKNIIINTIQGISRFNVNQEERVFCALPLFHSFPQNTSIWSNVVLGCTAIIVPKLDRKSIIKGLSHNPTIIIGVPAIYGLFCKMATLNFGKIRYFFSGGDALTDKIRSYFELIYRRKLCNGYGLTETSPFVCVDTDDLTQPTNTIGKPFLDIDIEIRNNENLGAPSKKLEHGEIGILWIKGPNIMQGYYKSPEETNKVLQNGWFNTGDLAYIDKNGKIVLAGREKDLIKHKGIKIYPQEIENILLYHPKVMQAGVIGVIEDSEEIPVAFVASKSDMPNNLLIKELIDLCKRNLANYKIPKKFIVYDELPLTSTGKVDKKRLRAEYKAN